MPNIYVRGRLA